MSKEQQSDKEQEAGFMEIVGGVKYIKYVDADKAARALADRVKELEATNTAKDERIKELMGVLQGVVDSFYIGEGFFCPNLHDCDKRTKTHNCKPCSIFMLANATKRNLTKLKE
jgi:hypothetical protein